MIIQRAWRKHVDTAVFKHLKKLLSFHNQGDPRLLLRFINPAEANILDAASGALIRFRLGGFSTSEDPIFKLTEDTKKTEFHHCKIRRQQDVARKKKMRKIEWMRKMYAEGRTGHSKTAQQLQNSPETLLDSFETSDFEQEVDELLAWTRALDFDDYINEWRNLGTSRCYIVDKDDLSVDVQRDFGICEISPLRQDESRHLDLI
ncbi:protein MFI-like isoform X3 [Danio rerio]